MDKKQVAAIAKHFSDNFEQPHLGILENDNIEGGLAIILFAPTQKYPFWKLCTAGASQTEAEGTRSEYMIFVDPSVRFFKGERDMDVNLLAWYYNVLANSALYPRTTGSALSYRRIVTFDCGGNMAGVTALLPEVIEKTDIFTYRNEEGQEVTCYLLVTVTSEEIEAFKANGVDYLENRFLHSDETFKIFCEPMRKEK